MKKTFTFINLKKQLFFLMMILGTLVFGQANGPALEMTAGMTNPTGNGPLLTTAINFHNNSDGPTGTTFVNYQPVLTATYTITNPQYTTTVGASPMFIGYSAGAAAPIFDLMNSQGGAADAHFTSAGANAGSGMNVNTNRAVRMFILTYPLRVAGAAPGGTHRMADLTITFNRPVNNPVIHLGALGGTSATLGFAGRFELIASVGTLSATPLTRLSGNEAAGFSVLGNAIFNNATTIAGSGAGSGSGSVMINGTNLTSITFRVYVRGDGRAGSSTTSWASTNTDTTTGESFTIGFSTLESDIVLTKTINNPNTAVGGSVAFTVTARNNGPSNNAGIIVNDLLPSGYTFLSATPSVGTYNPVNGNWSIGNLLNGASQTLTINASVNPTGNYINVATVTGATVADSNTANNKATAFRNSDTDGDGIFDPTDLDDDNDGILDALEDSCTKPNRIANGDFTSGATSWTTNYSTTTPNTSGGISFAGGVVDILVDNPGTLYANNILMANSATFDLTAGVYYNFSSTLNFPSGTTNVNFSWVLIDASNNVVQTIQSYRTTASGVGEVTITGAATAYPVSFLSTQSGTYRLALTWITNSATSGNAHDVRIDNVTLTFPCNADTDLIPNYLDLDSDGDGCFDAIEGDENVLIAHINANGSIRTNAAGTPNGNNIATVNANGIPTLVNTGGAADIGSDVGQGLGISQNLNIQDAQCSTAIGCTNALYLSQSNTLYSVNTSTNPFTYPLVGVNLAGDYNAIGVNPIDGRIYGIPAISSNNVIVINANGSSINLGPILNLPAGNYNAGEIDDLGNYYVKEAGVNNQMFRINLTTLTATTITLSANISISDLAFRTTNGLFYAVGNDTGRLISINPDGTVIGIGNSPGAIVFGAMFASSTGEIYGSDNAGGFYQFNITNGQRVLISDSPPSGANDGAHCVTTPIVFSADLSVTKSNNAATYLQGTSTIYTIVVRNNGPFGVLGATVADPVPTGIPAANVSYTAAVSGGATTAVSGTQIGAINDVVNLPVNGTVTYTVTVNIPAAFTGNLVNTATVTPPANSTDSNTGNNTATDTDTPYCTGTDSDGDGIPDICDLDDDNDGILDAVESPNCFFAASEARSMINSITSQFPTTDNFNLLYNYIIEPNATAGFNFTSAVPAASNPAGSNLFTIELAKAVQLSSIILTDNISNTAGASARLFGSNDNVNFVQLTSAQSNINTAAGATFTIDQNIGKYRFYKIQTTVTGSIAVADFIGEIIPVVAANYIASEYPKGTCTDDQDGDGTVNHLDLDADGDGCFDAIEGDENVTSAQLTAGRITGAVDARGVPALVNSGGAADIGGDQGQGIGQARSADRNDCLDSDGDTIPDWIDLDDDNDGILDTAECPNNYIVRPVVTSSITTVSTITSGDIQKIANYEGAGLGIGNAPAGETIHWYTNVRNLPIFINMNMQAASTMDHIKLFGPWGFDERMKDFKIEFYNSGNVLLGTENLTAPDQYTIPTILSFSKEYTNVTRVVFTIISDQGYSAANPPRVSITEIVFLDLQICDNDGDGIPNRLDLDADGDGCFDAIEGDENVLSAHLNVSGSISTNATGTPNGNGVATVNANGIPTLVNAGGTADIGGDVGQGIGNSQAFSRNDCLDSDGDGIPDWQDLDDDNDGILDTAENECLGPVFAGYPATIPVILSTDFGRPFTGTPQTNLNLTADLSHKFGYAPNSGAVIVRLYNAHVHPNVNEFYVRGDLPVTRWEITGTAASIVGIEHGSDYYPGQVRSINLLDNAATFVAHTPSDATWTNTNTGNLFTLQNISGVRLIDVGLLHYASAEYNNSKRFELGTNESGTDRWSTYFVRILPECDTDLDGIPNRLDLDSDNDGCLDAIEGDENVIKSQLVDAADGLSVGFGSTALDQNLCSTNACVNANGVPNLVNSGGTADIGNDVGQGIGSSLDANINTCFCTQPPTGGTPDGFTMVGVSTHATQISGWPENVGNGFIALDSQTKGFVITRVGHVGGTDGTPLPADYIADPVEGMMVYDLQDNCVKLFNGDIWKCIERGCNTPPPTN